MQFLVSFFLLVLIVCIKIEKVATDDCAILKDFVLSEFKKVQDNEAKFEHRIAELERENSLKDRKIQQLEQQLEYRLDRRSVVPRQTRHPVAFTAYLAHHVHNITQHQPIVYDRILLNDGGAYSGVTGMFTAPVSGVYMFSWSVGAKYLPSFHLPQFDVFTRLVVNGVHQLSAVAESTDIDDDEQGSATAILFVLEGDKVWTIHEYRGGNNLFASDDERVTSFTGTLLYEKNIETGIIG